MDTQNTQGESFVVSSRHNPPAARGGWKIMFGRQEKLKRLEAENKLEEALEIISDESFKHHVGKGRNDFHKWVKREVNDPALAEKIKLIKSQTIRNWKKLSRPRLLKKRVKKAKKRKKKAIRTYSINNAIPLDKHSRFPSGCNSLIN